MLVCRLLLRLFDVYGDKIKNSDLEILDLFDLVSHLFGLILDNLISRKGCTGQLRCRHPVLLFLLFIIHKEKGLQLVAWNQDVCLYHQLY